MNGTILKKQIPKFVDLNNLPEGYYEEVNAQQERVPCKVNIQKLSEYVKNNNCSVTDITQQESTYFMNS